ncbi:MAG TPA: carboxysome shell carbonic anhydrase [Candidatus Moranbacteria bacterium]|nr:carboxysome shell carbonic anhydrase [Candidatus Moranbacteria bacterium]
MEQKIKTLIELNQKHSELYCAQRLERALYKAKHPTRVVAFKCMDGRIHLPAITHTPLGIIRPYRNIGGKFDLGWPLLNISFDRSVEGAIARGDRVLVLVTYHYSAGSEHRGCAGFHYDCEEAKRFTATFKEQIERVYGKGSQVVVPILVGVETDKDAMILHGATGEIVDLSTVEQADEEDLRIMLRRLYPQMPERVVEDLLPLVAGNIGHIAKIKGQKPLSELEHGEWVLAVGKGFDWLHTPNMALIVGPYDPNIGEPIKTAASIIKGNLEAGRIERNGFVILSSAICADAYERLRAIERSRYMSSLTKEIVEKNYPEIVEKMHIMSVIIDQNTMKMEVVD